MPVEAPNTLRSRARYKIIDIISQGPIKGLVNGAKSVYLDETPIQASNGTLNFKNFEIASDLQELPIPDVTGRIMSSNPSLFPLSENEVSVGVEVTKDSPKGSLSGDGSITRTISDANVDAVRVTLRVPALATTNTTTGDITGGKIDLQIMVKPDGGVFMPARGSTRWIWLASHDSETRNGATGIDLEAELTISENTPTVAKWEYRKKTGGTWGSWIQFGEVYIPASSASTAQSGFYSSGGILAPQVHKKIISGLAPGIYQARAVSIFGTVTPISAREEYGDNTVGYITIEGKTTSPYDADYIVQLPGTGPWDIKVSRISADPPTANIQADLYWLSYTEQISNRFSWPNTAGVAITFDAEDFGGNIPSRAYDVMGLMVKIPANYDPYARTYSGIWNGTFKTDWTDNPAWIFYDLLTNKRYGLGDNIDAAQIDKYALYQIAQYCDELVDAPNGEVEPRYTCSCVINSQSEAYELLTAIASAFRGMIYLSGGTITPTADMPSDPILNVGPAKVIDGLFTYQGASRKSRHTVARVSWNNPDDGYKLNVELYEDDEAIRKYGYRPIDINAFGCTSRGLARRWGKWSVVSDNDAPDTVTYKAGFDHFKLRPGNVINIADPNYSGEQLFGLIMSVTDNVSPATHTIKLDRAVTRLAGDTSELQVTLVDGTILLLDVAVLSNTTSDEITIDSVDLTDTPLAGASWLLKKGTVEPRQWRVISVSEDEPNIYQVTAMLYDPNKFDKIESDLNFAEADFTAFPSGPMPAPTALITSEFLKQTGSAILACVNLSWTRPNDPRADWFEVQYQLDGEEWRTTEPNVTQFTGIDILNIVPGTYNFRVRAQDTSGLFRSAWTTLAGETISGKNKKPEDVTGFTAAIEKYGVLLNWSPVSDIDIKYYEIRRGADWASGDFVGRTAGTVFKWEDATEAEYTFWIKAIDTNLNESENATDAAATVAVEDTPTVTGATVKGGIVVTITGVTTSRFAHYELQRKKTTDADGAAVTVNALLASREFTDTLVAALGYVPLYQYRARAINKNLNPGAYSDWSTGVNPGQITGADMVAGALNNSALFAAGVVDATALGTAAATEAKIAANAVTEGKIAALAVTAGKIAASAVIAEKIDAGAVTTAKLAAGAVTAEKLLIGKAGSALNESPDFSDPTAWSGGGGTFAAITDGVVGNSAWRTIPGLSTVLVPAKQIPMDAQKKYRVRLWARSVGANGALLVRVVDASNVWGNYYEFYGAAVSSSWQEIYGIVSSASLFTPPKYILVMLIANYSGSVGYIEAQDFRIEEVLPSTLIQDGSITTDKILANAITSGKIAAGEVKTANLEANCVTADKLLIGRSGSALNQDPNFEDASAWWNYSGNGWLTTVSDGLVGNKALQTNASWAMYVTSSLIPVDNGKQYRITCLARSLSGSPTGSYIWVAAHVAGNESPDSVGAPYGFSIGTSWTRCSVNYIPTTRWIRAGWHQNSDTAACQYQDFRIEEIIPGTLIQDGAITTNKLATDAIKSLNYSTTAGSFLNLADGTFTFGGGSSAPKLSWNGTTLAVNGSVTATAGQIASFGLSSASMQSLTYIPGGTESVTIYGSSESTPGLQVNHDDASYETNVTITPNTGAGVDTAPVIISVDSSAKYGLTTYGRVYSVGGFYPTSDENAKSDIVDVSVLGAVKTLRVKKYRLDNKKIANIRREKEIERNLKTGNVAVAETAIPIEPDFEDYNPCKSIGVMAQDFNKAFGISHNNPETYNLTDAIGVALRAIQELAEIVDEQKAEIAELRAALNLPEKQERKKKEVERELNDEEKELLHIVENMARKSILKKLLEAEKK